VEGAGRAAGRRTDIGELTAGAKGFQFYSTLFVLIDLAAIAAWFAISGAEDPAPPPQVRLRWAEPSGSLAFRVSSYVPA
jgi:hypothetical protein